MVRMRIRDIGRRVGDAAAEEAVGAGGEAIQAIEREAQRRRDEACTEVARFKSKVARFEEKKAGRRFAPVLALRLMFARGQLGRAEDRCAAVNARPQ